MQAGTEAVAKETTGDTLHDTVNNVLVHLQQVHEVEAPLIEPVFTCKLHAYKFSMKVSFHSCIICLHSLQNYKYTIQQKCYMFF